MKNQKSKIHGVTLIELLTVVALLAVLMIVMAPHLRGSRQVWEVVGDRHPEVLQNARIGLDKIARELRQAQSINAAGSNYVEFTDNDSADWRFQLNSGYLEYGLVGALDTLAGPVDSLSFTYYEQDGVTATTTADDVRSVLIQMTTSDSEGIVSDVTLSSRVLIRKDPVTAPTVIANDATNIHKNNACLHMDYDFGDHGSGFVEFAYRKATGGAWTYTGWAAKSGSGSYFRQIAALTPGTTYNFKARLKYDSTVIESAEKSFTTLF